MENISKEIILNIDGYYPIKFADDLRLFCKGRSDAELNIQLPSQFPSAYRRIRIGTSGWEPNSEDKSRFYICLYYSSYGSRYSFTFST